MDEQIKIKLLDSWMAALFCAYQVQVTHFKPEGPHQLLLLNHAAAMYRKLHGKLMGEVKKKYSLSLTPVEALAFMQWWGIVPLESGTLAAIVVAHLIEAIDQQSKRPRPRLVINYGADGSAVSLSF